MKRRLRIAVAAAMLLCLLPFSTLAAEYLIPVGEVIGLHLSDNCVTIAAFDDLHGAAAKNAGLQIGDEIVAIDGCEIDCAEDVRHALGQTEQAVSIQIRRHGKLHTLTATPKPTAEGPRLGIYLKQGITGIGTVTWYDPETSRFGALGHGVSDSSGALLRLVEGNAFEADILSIKKGQRGEPGQLKGGAQQMRSCGLLLRNTPQGVFGISHRKWAGSLCEVAAYSEVKTGSAVILSTVCDQGAQEYSVEILKIYPKDRPDHRNFLLKITDPDLLDTTGGIVQGMSGSPIIQNGKLIGAVTHVLVNDPTTGYGIFIENMLDAAA